MRIKRLLPALALAIVLPGASFWAASGGSDSADAPSARSDSRPVTLEAVAGSSVYKVVLSERAAERLGIETAPVRARETRTVIPYSAVLYDAHGNTWAYTNPNPLVFVRHSVSIDYIDGGDAVLIDGPPPGTMAVTVGAAELFGAELFGAVGK
jgi:hypothetical protein